MSRFVSLRSLVILAPLVVLIGVMVPLATLAASPATDPTVTVTNRCTVPGEGPQVIATFKKGQEVTGSAVMTGNDAKDEEEALSLSVPGSSFALLVKANFGPKSFAFTTTRNNQQLVACYVQIRADDDGDWLLATFATDHPASVKYSINKH